MSKETGIVSSKEYSLVRNTVKYDLFSVEGVRLTFVKNLSENYSTIDTGFCVELYLKKSKSIELYYL